MVPMNIPMSRDYATCPARSEMDRAWHCWDSSASIKWPIRKTGRPLAASTPPVLIMDIRQFINMEPSKAEPWPFGGFCVVIRSIRGVMTPFLRRILAP
jgi:hypothetical protein